MSSTTVMGSVLVLIFTLCLVNAVLLPKGMNPSAMAGSSSELSMGSPMEGPYVDGRGDDDDDVRGNNAALMDYLLNKQAQYRLLQAQKNAMSKRNKYRCAFNAVSCFGRRK
ncbi:hypothetical protein RvY_11472-1 [Ramazzottius varieornatus]|uniref:Uncharacterized protein n=1 Tax=Ramazzottius varieornatus TaxID=947166 RepID=A0A1D1VG97_RAMVA|nr:hypothetical protein RvY_11472-1 [Ramazzottius varieornatus]